MNIYCGLLSKHLFKMEEDSEENVYGGITLK